MAVLCEIPGLGGHIVFDFDARARLARAHLALDAHHTAHEMIGRARQTRHATRSIEARVHRPERLRRLAPGAGEQRTLVEAEPVHFGNGLGLRSFAHKFRVARQRPIRHQAQAHPARVERLEPVDCAEKVRVHSGQRAVVHLLDEHLAHQFLRGGDHLAATLQPVRLLGHRLEAPAITGQGVAQACQIDGHHL